MELLKRTFASPVFAALAFVGLAGCLLVDALRLRDRGLVFSHEQHVVGEGLQCVSCHERAEAEEAPDMPSADSCAVCHDQLDEEKAPERRVAARFDAQGYRSARVSRLDDEVRFDHLGHVGALQDCASCHRDIEHNEVVDESLAVDSYSTGAGPSTYDVYSVLTHEFGHFAGLDHVTDRTHTMYPSTPPDCIIYRTLCNGDAEGLHALYP